MRIETIEKLLTRVTVKERTYLKAKALAVFLYFNGLSFRNVDIVLRYLGFKVSYEAVRKWVHSLAKLLTNFKTKAAKAYIDETVIKKGKKVYRFWLSVSKEGKLIFAWLSRRRDRNTAKLVLYNTQTKKVVIDKGPWYIAASKELGFDLKHETFGERNVVERAFMPIKIRMLNTKQFGVGWPAF